MTCEHEPAICSKDLRAAGAPLRHHCTVVKLTSQGLFAPLRNSLKYFPTQ